MDQKKIIIIGSVGVLVVGMLVLGVLVYRNRTTVTEETPTEEPSATGQPTPAPGGKLGGPSSAGTVTNPAPAGKPTSSATSSSAGLPGVTDRTPDYTGATDTDKDGLPDAREHILGTDPKKPDTDGDGFSDGDEAVKYGSDPLDPKSTPKTIEGHEKFGL